jgi:hypothetical protein
MKKGNPNPGEWFYREREAEESEWYREKREYMEKEFPEKRNAGIRTGETSRTATGEAV